MHWFYLFLAGLLEVAWAVGLKFSEGLTRPLIACLTLGAMALSVFFLSLAMKTLPLGTAYAIWTGIGAVGAALLGILLLGESASPGRIVSLVIIFIGIIGLKLTSPS